MAWQQSSKGKWYLTEVFEYGTVGQSDLRTHYRDFHSAYCEEAPDGDPEAHSSKQAEISSGANATKARGDSAIRRNQSTAPGWVLELYELAHSEIITKLVQVEAELERELRDPVSMDYIVEHGKYVAKLKMLRTQIDILKARAAVEAIS